MFKRLARRQVEPVEDDDIEDLPVAKTRSSALRFGVPAIVGVPLLVILLLSFYWDVDQPFFHPPEFDVREVALRRAGGDEKALVTGYVTTSTLIELVSLLLDKPGGFLSNDVLPPGVFMDNTRNWEWGMVTEIRDFARSLRNDMSRSQSQSTEDWDLAVAEPALNVDTNFWLFPSIESQFGEATKRLARYLGRLSDPNQRDAQFYPRADNLREWLSVVGRRLGSLSQRLSASVGQTRIDTSFVTPPGEPAAALHPAPRPDQFAFKTPWMEIDDVFYEARGHTFALVHLLRAIEMDFAGVLQNKNAQVSVRQIIRELESTLDTLWSPMVLNGTGLGPFANHSLVMASYISRANAAVIDLVSLLLQG